MPEDSDIQRLQLRIPVDLYEQVKELADDNFRSANAEILYLVSLGLGKIKETTSPEEIRQIVRDELAKSGIKKND